MTPAEFFEAHRKNMQGDEPIDTLSFYQWLASCEEPPGKFVPALQLYYAGHELKGCFSMDEITSYRNVFHHFWWVRLNIEEGAVAP